MEISLSGFRRYFFSFSFYKISRRRSLNCFKRFKHQLSFSKLESKDTSLNKISTLYVPSRLGGQTFQIVKPLIDVKEITENLEDIKLSAQLRGHGTEFNNLVNLLHDWQSKQKEFDCFVCKSRELMEKVKHLKTLDLIDESKAVEKEHDILLPFLKKAKEELQDSKEVILPLVQSIPNTLDPLTPIKNNYYHQMSDPFNLNFVPLNHGEIGNRLGFLKFIDSSPSSYYLAGTFADIEVAAQNFFSDKLKNSGYDPLSCVDFCKSFIVEAIGLNPHSADESIQLKDKASREMGQKLHLVGGASFESFCAYLVNMNVNEDTFPARYMSLGRHYDAKFRHSLTADLFSVVQSTNVHCLSICDKKSEKKEFNDLFNLLVSFYKEFKIPFRIVNVCAKELNVTETCKNIIELYSPCQQEYIPVAYVSQHGDFISKRLNITYGCEHEIYDYCRMVEGVAIKVPVLVGCIVENFQKSNEEFKIPHELNFLQEYIC